MVINLARWFQISPQQVREMSLNDALDALTIMEVEGAKASMEARRREYEMSRR